MGGAQREFTGWEGLDSPGEVKDGARAVCNDPGGLSRSILCTK